MTDKFITPQNCGNCEHWNKETKDCKCPVLFPDSAYSCSSGFRRKMPASAGRLCPTHKRKIDICWIEEADSVSNDIYNDIHIEHLGGNGLEYLGKHRSVKGEK